MRAIIYEVHSFFRLQATLQYLHDSTIETVKIAHLRLTTAAMRPCFFEQRKKRLHASKNRLILHSFRLGSEIYTILR